MANPIALQPFNAAIELYALFSEAVVIALLLRYYGFYPIRTFFIWMFLTIITYILFIWIFLFFLISVFGQSWTISLIIGVELLIILTEAKIIQKLSLWKIFNPKQYKLTIKDALLVSLIGNLVSIAMGFIHLLRY